MAAAVSRLCLLLLICLPLLHSPTNALAHADLVLPVSTTQQRLPSLVRNFHLVPEVRTHSQAAAAAFISLRGRRSLSQSDSASPQAQVHPDYVEEGWR